LGFESTRDNSGLSRLAPCGIGLRRLKQYERRKASRLWLLENGDLESELLIRNPSITLSVKDSY